MIYLTPPPARRYTSRAGNDMATHSKLWYFEHLRMIDALTTEQRRQLAAVARMFEVKRGQRIYMPGDPAEEVYLLKAGAIKIASRAPDGSENILALLHRGDIFGELALIDEQPRDHLAEAADDSVLCAFERETLARTMRETPEIGFQITKLIGLRLRTFQTRVEELLFKSAPGRLAHVLLDLASEHGVPDAEGVVIPLRLSQSDLAHLVGLRRETVNAILHEWRDQGLVQANRRAIRLRDPERLRQIA